MQRLEMARKVKGKQRLLATAISLSLAGYAPTALPLGLGAAQVQSQIGEPLLAEIPILDGESKYDANEILVRQVRGALAEQLGFDLAAESVGYYLKIVERNGDLFLLVRSRKVMSEPFVSVLVEVEWPNGKLYRDYNLLLDLAPLPVAVPVVSDSSFSRSSRAQLDENTIAAASDEKARNSSTTSADVNRRARINYRPLASSDVSPATTGGWRVGGGDTLSQIAQKIRPDDQIKLTAVVEAIFRLNPQAFVNGDINRLQGGALLNLPEPSDFAAMPRWDGRPSKTLTTRIPSEKARPESVSSTSDRSSPETPLSAATNASSAPERSVRQSIGQSATPSGNSAQQGTVVNQINKPDRASSALAEAPYRVEPGDTLSQVAQRLRQDPSVKLQEMMRLLFEYNPTAFTDGDINQLQLGATLHVPPHGNVEAPATLAPAELAVADSGRDDIENLANRSSTSERIGVEEASLSDSSARLTLSAQRAAQGSTSGSDSSAQEILSQIDAVAELVDKVNRENQSIRQRIERIEHSEQLALLERLLELQTRQIKNLRQAMLAEQSSNPSADGSRVPLEADFVVADLIDTEKGLLGDEGAVTASEAAILQQHLAGQTTVEAKVTGSTDLTSSPAAVIEVDVDGREDPPASAKLPAEKAAEQVVGKARPEAESSTAWSFLFWGVAAFSIVMGWLLLARRRQTYDWLNNKLRLFEQNSDEASLPRVWDPDLGAWRVKEDIRKPVLTPLATSLPEIEKALAEHEKAAAALEVDDKAPAVDDITEQVSVDNQSVEFELSNNPIDEMFETLPDSELDDLSQEELLLGASSEQEDSTIPLLDDVQTTAEVALEAGNDELELVLDNLDGEFEFTLPEELFAEPEPEKISSPADAKVKASILEKTKNYDPENIDEVLDDWLHGGIPAPQLSEYEDVISEAMIYAAYGRHEHAEQLLLEQLETSPDEAALHSALAEVRKSNAQFKSGQGFGADIALTTGFSLPSETQQLSDLTLDIETHPKGSDEKKSDSDDFFGKT